jgi:hypothetical protein
LPCILTEVEIKYDEDDAATDEQDKKAEWMCELQGSDVERGQATFVSLEGLDELELISENVISGNTVFRARNAEILPGGQLRIPPNSQREFGCAPPRGPASNDGNGGDWYENWTAGSFTGDCDGNYNVFEGGEGKGRGLQATSKKVLAIRIKAPDANTTASVDAISDSIFGTSGDSINLKERYDSCSYGQLTIDGYRGTTATNVTIPGADFAVGVVEVEISLSVIGAAHAVIRDEAVNAATALLGNLPNQFDHVMLCLPPGTIDSWLAYGKSQCHLPLCWANVTCSSN